MNNITVTIEEESLKAFLKEYTRDGWEPGMQIILGHELFLKKLGPKGDWQSGDTLHIKTEETLAMYKVRIEITTVYEIKEYDDITLIAHKIKTWTNFLGNYD